MVNAKNDKPQTLHLLALEKSRNSIERWVKLFRNAGHRARFQQVSTLEDLEEQLSAADWDIFLAIEETPLLTAEQSLSTLQRLNIDLPLLVILSESNPDLTAQWLSKGARDAIAVDNESHMLQAVLREKISLDARQQLRHLKAELAEAEQRCQQLLDNASQAIAYVHDGMHVDTNRAYLKLFGYNDPEDLAGVPLIDMVCAKDQESFKHFIRQFQPGLEQPEEKFVLEDDQGASIPASLALSGAIFDGEACIQVLVKPELPATKSTVRSEDSPLLNREAFMKQLQATPSPSLAYLQLDNYDRIRNEAGVDGTVAVQTSVTRLLSDHLPESKISHYGDEVYLATFSTPDVDQALKSLETLRESIENELIAAEEHTLHTSASIGLAKNNQETHDPGLLQKARTASDMVKGKGGNRVELYSQSAVNAARAVDGDTLAIIRQALEHDHFKLLFQPVISITGDGEEYYEVLLRLLNPQGKEVPAAEFIKTAEDGGLMPFIDRWVLRQAIRQLVRKRSSGEDTRLMVHVSAATLGDSEFPGRLARLLDAAGLAGKLITLQMCEPMIHQRLRQVIDFTKQLKPLGCKTAIVQFSGEMRSMKILQHLDVDFIKLDSRYTKLLDTVDTSRLQTTIKKLKAQNKQTIMPKVENAQTMTRLWQLGVDYAQGYYLQPPLESMNYDFES